jgi:hypothetical protein
MQYFIEHLPAKGWNDGVSPNMLVNWRAERQQCGNIPDRSWNWQSCKVRSTSINFGLEGQLMSVNPAVFGQRWNIQVKIQPVIPKLIKSNLLD